MHGATPILKSDQVARLSGRKYPHPIKSSAPCSRVRKYPLRPVHVAGTQGQELSTTHNKSMTEQIFDAVDAANTTKQAGGAGGATTYETFKRVDEGWLKLRTMKEGAAAGPAPTFVQEVSQPLPDNASPTFDVTVCGGTLGIFAATALAQKGLKVAVIERGLLRGREQEWNISRKEMEELVKLGLLTMAELNECISNEFNPVRIGFLNGEDVWTKDVLNLGASPAKLIDKMRGKLEAAGGKIFERAILEGVMVHSNGASLAVKSASGGGGDAGQPPVLTYLNTVSTRLLVDCMGHQSPIVKQLRWGKKPDGVCLVVGSLSSGFENNKTADVIYTNTDLQPADANVTDLQYFWEAFPAGSGKIDRTSYMFTYIDAQEYRPSLADVYEDYWDLMPKYQNVDLKDITPKRLLFGYFPTFRDSPMPPGFSRVLQIGDASGIQSPLSFGGFGAMTRHIKRLVNAIGEAVEVDALDKASLGLINFYNPGLSSAWMLQRAMSVRTGDKVAPNLINRMLAGNFKAMEGLGDPVMKPFLQDVIQLGPLMSTLTKQMLTDPMSIPQLLAHVGPVPLLDWMKHVAALGFFSAAHGVSNLPGLKLATKKLPPDQRFRVNRVMDAFEFGSGLDYKL